MDAIVKRIVQLLKENRMTAKELTVRLGINKSSVSDWKAKKTKPSVEDVIGISRIFDVSLDWLLSDKDTDSSIVLTMHEENLILNYRSMSKEQQFELLNTTACMLNNSVATNDSKKITTSSQLTSQEEYDLDNNLRHQTTQTIKKEAV